MEDIFEKEVWKPTHVFPERYMISNMGRVKSVPHVKKCKNNHGSFQFTTKEKIMKVCLTEDGYQRVSLMFEGKKKSVGVAKLVAMAFVDGFEQGKQVNHIDGNKLNNYVSNLEWVTPQENMLHCYRIGLASNKGEKHPRKILNDALVAEIRQKSVSGQSIKDISDELGINYHTIHKAVSGKNWSHVPQPTVVEA